MKTKNDNDEGEVLVSDGAVTCYRARKVQMIVRAQAKVMLATCWVNVSELADLAGLISSSGRSEPIKWRADNKIFSVNFNGEELYPIYALDQANGFRPFRAMRAILDLFSGTKDSWGAAYWFASINGYLGGRAPQDVLAINPELVIQAAKDELTGINHG